jgi:hypothetical protein
MTVFRFAVTCCGGSPDRPTSGASRASDGALVSRNTITCGVGVFDPVSCGTPSVATSAPPMVPTAPIAAATIATIAPLLAICCHHRHGKRLRTATLAPMAKVVYRVARVVGQEKIDCSFTLGPIENRQRRSENAKGFLDIAKVFAGVVTGGAAGAGVAGLPPRPSARSWAAGQ